MMIIITKTLEELTEESLRRMTAANKFDLKLVEPCQRRELKIFKKSHYTLPLAGIWERRNYATGRDVCEVIRVTVHEYNEDIPERLVIYENEEDLRKVPPFGFNEPYSQHHIIINGMGNILRRAVTGTTIEDEAIIKIEGIHTIPESIQKTIFERILVEYPSHCLERRRLNRSTKPGSAYDSISDYRVLFPQENGKLFYHLNEQNKPCGIIADALFGQKYELLNGLKMKGGKK